MNSLLRNSIDDMKREGMSDEAIIAEACRRITDIDTLEEVRVYLVTQTKEDPVQ